MAPRPLFTIRGSTVPKIRFTTDHQVADTKATKYKTGQVEDMNEASANRFVSLGVAEFVEEMKAEAKAVKDAEESTDHPKIPAMSALESEDQKKEAAKATKPNQQNPPEKKAT